MAHDDRWTVGWCKQLTCGWLDDEKSAGDDTWAQSRGGGGLREDGLDRWAPSASDCGMGNGRWTISRAKMGWVRCRAGLTAEKTTHNVFSILNPFPIE
jgi:hypothetical protein